jgi:hypothetical protein
MLVRPHKSPVIVTGMHRSGTSMVAAIMSALSIDMGQELLQADSNNVRGYFEDVEFQQLQRTILSESCAANDGGHLDWGWTESESLDKGCFKRFLPEASALIARRSERATPWGWKDPRTTLLLDFWDELLDDPRYVLVYRYPWDVADSMQRLGAEVFLRNPEYGYRIWESYNRRIRDFYTKHSGRCLLISSNALGKQLAEFTRLIDSKLGIQTASAETEQICQPGLLKATGGCDPLIDLVAAVWPGCTQLLAELDELADISAAALWQARPVHTRLARPDSLAEGESIDVSVVTPCYNQGVLLLEAIASVERHAPPHCELIIVNDGSWQPRTLDILGILKRCGYFILDQQNLGLSTARNRAIEMARGRYILPLDDDNRIRANLIHDAISVLDSSPDVGVVYGDRYDFGLRTGERQVPEFDLLRVLRGNYIDACAVLRRQVWQDCGGYDASMSPKEDWELWVHAGERGWGFHHLPYVAFDYRVRPDSLISNFGPQALQAEILYKHPRSHRDLLSAELASEREHAGLLFDQLAAEREHVRLLSSELAVEQQRGELLSATVEQIKGHILEQSRTIQSLTSGAAVSLERQGALEEHQEALLRQLAERDAELAKIKRSAGWRSLQSYGRIKYRHLLPIYRLLGLASEDVTQDSSPSRDDLTASEKRIQS